MKRRDPTRAERLAMIGRPLLHQHPEHNFKQSRADWERAVFDNAAHFLALDMQRPMNDPQNRRIFPTFPEAIAYAQDNDGVCIYAVTATERSTVLDRRAWPEWAERWQRRRGR